MVDWNKYKGKTEFTPRVRFEEKGTTVSGTVIRVHEVTFDGGRSQNLAVDLDTTDGPVTIVASQIQLQRLLADVEPTVGTFLSITYQGRKHIGDGKFMKVFEVTSR